MVVTWCFNCNFALEMRKRRLPYYSKFLKIDGGNIHGLLFLPEDFSLIFLSFLQSSVRLNFVESDDRTPASVLLATIWKHMDKAGHEHVSFGDIVTTLGVTPLTSITTHTDLSTCLTRESFKSLPYKAKMVLLLNFPCRYGNEFIIYATPILVT